MKLTATSPLLTPPASATSAAAPREPSGEPARAALRPDPDKGGHATGDSRHRRTSAQATTAGEHEARVADFEFIRTLTRGRIEGLQTALRILAQPATASDPALDLPQLRAARVTLCDRLQAQYALFLSAPATAPAGLPGTCRGSWRRSQLRQLLEEDLAWARSLPGDHQDLVRALTACVDRIVPHHTV